jgi:phosphoglycerol transferase MdoB-like AlkP superfamily enzyme
MLRVIFALLAFLKNSIAADGDYYFGLAAGSAVILITLRAGAIHSTVWPAVALLWEFDNLVAAGTGAFIWIANKLSIAPMTGRRRVTKLS